MKKKNARNCLLGWRIDFLFILHSTNQISRFSCPYSISFFGGPEIGMKNHVENEKK